LQKSEFFNKLLERILRPETASNPEARSPMATAASGIPVREHLMARLANARARTDELFRIVRPEALYDRPIPERHRIIFYRGHLEAFDWNLLRPVFDCEPFHPAFDRLFAFGIDPVGGHLPTDRPSDWPSRTEVEDYNARVRQMIDACLGTAALDDPGQPLLYDGFLLHVAIEHRLMHAETLAYMLHHLPLDRKFGRPIVPAPAAGPVAPRMLEIPAGEATLGLSRAANGTFGWDNEFEEHRVVMPAFAIDAYNVTNSEFLNFVSEGGYDHRALWTDADWEWKESRDVAHPSFWTRRGERWHYRAMFAEMPLPMDWPVYVSHAEASAYARWAGKALPSEAQFHRAAYGTPHGVERAFPWGCEPPSARHGNFDFCRWDPAPVGAYPAGASAFGVADLVGNGWEWTNTLFGPFPRFEPFAFYAGYSADFFDSQHYVAKGASSRTAACLLRRSFRNWFQPRYPYVYAAFRCVSN
jgi:ergothioneine biosynthesis protein EgtB